MRRFSSVECFGFVFKGLELDTPTLNYYFKSVHINPFLHDAIRAARNKMGFIK
ncbi:hypothetical protein [Priestia megaterium]|uniref:hypothetical protein n=1 Tax=Priestia megaterium TaxID=1404 RepID=UPI0015E4831A|nr:hypothetical protein [Priestia megaterium]